MIEVENFFIYWPGRRNLRLGRQLQRNYRPGNPPGHISSVHLDRVWKKMDIYFPLMSMFMSTDKKPLLEFTRTFSNFIPLKRKSDLVYQLIHRWFCLASDMSKFHFEIGKLKEILLSNVYFQKFIDKCVSRFVNKLHIKVRTQCFAEKNREKKLWYSYFFWKDISREYIVVSKFVIEVPKFNKNVVICIITVKKVHDLSLKLLPETTILAYVSAHLLFCTYLLISNRKKHSSDTKHITLHVQTYCFNYLISRKL